jgi:hypothetical protein
MKFNLKIRFSPEDYSAIALDSSVTVLLLLSTGQAGEAVLFLTF